MLSQRKPRRGEIWQATISDESEHKLWLIVSNNNINENEDMYLAVRVTTTSKWAHLPTWVAIPPADHRCVHGYINTDTLTTLFPRDFDKPEPECAVSGATMAAIQPALLKTLGY